MMSLSKRWMMLIIFILGAMIASGCARTISQETRMAYDEARAAFQKATQAGAKKCAPCEYGTAEASLAWADHAMENYETGGKLDKAIRIAKEKSLEALGKTP